ncbi:TPA: glycosyltransferase family 2 protein [Streptococcus suis]
MIKFSVVVPIYNVENYIEDCVNSVLSQTYTNFELILVNDASPDQSLSIIGRLAANNSQIKVIDKKVNEGVSLARSSGLRAASGDMVLYLDGDDTLVSTALQTLAEKYEKYQSDIIIFPKVKEKKSQKYVEPYFSEEILFCGDNRGKLYEGFLKYGFFVIGFSAINRELALKYDMAREIQHIWIGEDLVQSLPLLTYARNILYIMEGLYVITYNQESVTRSNRFRKDRYLQAQITHRYLEKYLKIWNIPSLNEIYYYHVMKDAIEYALEGTWSTESALEGREYLLTIAQDENFKVAYDKGFPHEKNKRLLAFLLKNQLLLMSYFMIKIRQRMRS